MHMSLLLLPVLWRMVSAETHIDFGYPDPNEHEYYHPHRAYYFSVGNAISEGYLAEEPRSTRTQWQWWILTAFHEQSFLKMTMELIRDMELKMRQLQVMQEEYKKDANYELGIIAATVMEKFTHMTFMYKRMSHPTFWDKFDDGVNGNVLYTLQIIQSDYNEIRIEKNLFYDVLKDASKREAERKRKQAIQKEVRVQSKTKKRVPGGAGSMDMSVFTPEERLQMQEAYAIAKARRTDFSLTNETVSQAHEEYKRSLRQQKWLQKWRGFDPDREGIAVSKRLADIARTKQGRFLGLNPFK